MARYLIAGFSVLAMAWMLEAQDFQFKTRVDLVVVPTAVRDSAGKLVTGLSQKDFTILEDGQPQTISNFSDDPQPLSAAIIMDTGMGGISMRRLVPLFISLTAGFSPLDEMTSFRFDHLVHQLSDFTANTEQIEKSFDIVKTIAAKQPATVPPGMTLPTLPPIVQFLLGGLMKPPGGGVPSAMRPGGAPPVPGVGAEAAPQSRVLYDVLYEAAKALGTRPTGRRRIIFIVSDGQVSGENTHNFDEITQLLLRDDIQLYAVTEDSGAFEGRLGVLGSLAQATGGQTYRGLTTRSMEDAFGRITEQARNQYVLGYHSTNVPPEGLPVVRKIVVKGSDPKWRVIHRKGYTQAPWFTAIRTKPLDAYFNYSLAGPTFISRTTIDDQATGRRFTFQDFMGVGVFLGSARNVNAEIRIAHYSNGNLFPRNAGVTIPLSFNVGYAY